MKLLHMVRAIHHSTRSQCISNRVGAVITMNDRVVSFGENNTVDSDCRCNEHNEDMLNDDGKLKATRRPEHSTWSDENEIHAEMKALLSAHTKGVILNNAHLYTTASPCPNCAKHIEWYVATGAITKVYYLNKYDRGNDEWITRLQKYGCEVIHIKREELEKVVNLSNIVFNNNE